MTARMTTRLFCDRETRAPVDGMRTVCGLEFGPAEVSVDQLRHIAREFGWTSTGISDYCPEHTRARRQETA